MRSNRNNDNLDRLQGYLVLPAFLAVCIFMFKDTKLAAVGFVIWGLWVLYITRKDQNLGSIVFFVSVMAGPMLGACYVRYTNENNTTRFVSYLKEHSCKFVSEEFTGYSKGGCDRYDNCVDPEEQFEEEYFCAKTGSLIRFSQFVEGSYGQMR